MGVPGRPGGRPLLEKREKWRTPQLFRSLLNRQPGLYSAEMWASRLSDRVFELSQSTCADAR